MHQRRPRDSYGRADLIEGATILATVGRQKEAEALAQEAVSKFPDMSIEAYVSDASPAADERERLAQAMKKAKFPLCASVEKLGASLDMRRLPECQQ